MAFSEIYKLGEMLSAFLTFFGTRKDSAKLGDGVRDFRNQNSRIDLSVLKHLRLPPTQYSQTHVHLVPLPPIPQSLSPSIKKITNKPRKKNEAQTASLLTSANSVTFGAGTFAPTKTSAPY